MKRTACLCLAALLGGMAATRGQSGGVMFNNWATNWAAPWFGPGTTPILLVVYPETGPGYGPFACIPVGNTRLAGTGFTAELWGGTTVSSMQFLARRNFSTIPALQGCISSGVLAPIPFAAPGERVLLQVRVYDNKNGTITSWEQVDFTTFFGSSQVFTSPPLSTVIDPVRLTGEGMQAYCLTVDGFQLSLPVLSWSTDTNVPFASWLVSSRSIVAGDTVTLRVVVPNPAESVQWRFQGVDLPGATNHTLVLTNIQPAQSGSYSAATLITVGNSPSRGTNAIAVNVREARLTEPRFGPSGFSARLVGLTNRAAIIECSSNLLSWTSCRTQWIGSVFPPTATPSWCVGCERGELFSNPPTPAGPWQFYRLRVIP